MKYGSVEIAVDFSDLREMLKDPVHVIWLILTVLMFVWSIKELIK